MMTIQGCCGQNHCRKCQIAYNEPCLIIAVANFDFFELEGLGKHVFT